MLLSDKKRTTDDFGCNWPILNNYPFFADIRDVNTRTRAHVAPVKYGTGSSPALRVTSTIQQVWRIVLLQIDQLIYLFYKVDHAYSFSSSGWGLNSSVCAGMIFIRISPRHSRKFGTKTTFSMSHWQELCNQPKNLLVPVPQCCILDRRYRQIVRDSTVACDPLSPPECPQYTIFGRKMSLISKVADLVRPLRRIQF